MARNTKLTNKKTLFWFRQDLRISDNAGLFEAAKQGAVMPVYILDEDKAEAFKMGGASKWWLHHSLNNLNKSLDNKLNFYIGNAHDIIARLSRENNIDAVYWNRCYEPWRIHEDANIKASLKSSNIECNSFNGSLLWEPWEILKRDKTPYKIFTRFYRDGCLQGPQPRMPLPKPEKLTLLKDHKSKNTLNLLPNKNWYKKLELYWDIGEEAAQKKLRAFLNNSLSGYQENRNYPSKMSTSRLSPHLHFGEISANQVWHSTQARAALDLGSSDADCFLSELGWREFSYYLLYHFPELPRKNFQSKFDAFPWVYNDHFLDRWKKGQTGYPIVDAGMRELWQTGYMHNRVRMITASFLIKNLLIHWHHGEDWFWDCLVDADLANNSASWQWVAGSGVDAAPYFRIFNPVTQGEKFDADGQYTRRFVPELSKLPHKFLFKPWEAPNQLLLASGVILGETYPKPMVDLRISREQALLAYRVLSNTQVKH
jgi:deoxyribodipyrimidine photo-lyase